MKKETSVLLFYVLYFFWLFSVTYLTFNTIILNYFTLTVSLVYLIFLKEKGDIWWFGFGALIPLIVSIVTINGWNIGILASNLQYFPPWLSLAWATTVVALRKLYFVINK